MVIESINAMTLLEKHIRCHYGETSVLVIINASSNSAEVREALKADLANWRYELPRCMEDADYVIIETGAPSVVENLMQRHPSVNMRYYVNGRCKARKY